MHTRYSLQRLRWLALLHGVIAFGFGVAILLAPRPVTASTTSCAGLPITSLPPAPLTNANLTCDPVTGALIEAGPYTSIYNQTPLANGGFTGIVGTSTLGGGNTAGEVDAWVFGPSTGPSGGLGLPLYTPGVPYIQGIGPYGAVPIYSSTGFPISDITLANNANVLNGALEVGGVNPSATPEPLQLDASNNLKVNVAASSTLTVQTGNGAACQSGTLNYGVISVATATTTQLVPLSGTTKVYVCSIHFIAGGTTNVTVTSGTGTACGTNGTPLSGAYPLAAQAGLVLASGTTPYFVTTAGYALCLTNSAAVQVSGAITYVQQ